MPLPPKGKLWCSPVGKYMRMRSLRTTPSRSFPRDRRFPFPPARSKREKRPRPNTSPRIRFCRPWRQRARRICRKLRSGAGWEPPQQGRRSLKSWWPRALRSAERRRNLYASFPPKRACPSLPCCPNSSSPRCSPPNGSTASRRSGAASWARTSSSQASAIWSQRWFGTLRLWTARRCCSPPADPLWANAPAAAQRSRRAKTAISAKDETASSGCGGTTASLPPRRSA